jgi:hypothetical protein
MLKKWRGIVDYFQTFLREIQDDLIEQVQAVAA